ncbi:MAG TPA: sulfotransferase [Acidimicrobiales bacterium]
MTAGAGTPRPERPGPVALDDLADPVFSDQIQPILDMMADLGAGLMLDPEALMHDAVEATGLSDFGDGGFRRRLEVLCRALRTEAGLSAVGTTTSYGLLSGLLKNRLLIEDLCRRHPEILDVAIDRPIIICGLPRTGTTHLHNLLSADPGLRSLPYWESLEPVLAESERPRPGEVDPRLARTTMSVDLLNTAMPFFQRMHEMTVDHVHEEIQLLAIDFSTMLFETTALVPSWRDDYLSHDQTPSYGYLKKILQVMTWLRGGRRWVLKSPQHLEQFGPLARTFPDATFVVTHRDPASVTVSLATMVSYTARLSMAQVDPVAISAYWSDRVEGMLRSCVQDRHLLPTDRSIDITFDEFMADDVATVERIYELAGLAMTPEIRQAMDSFIVRHPRGRHGTISYDPESLGLDLSERRRALSFYSDRFGVASEGP